MSKSNQQEVKMKLADNGQNTDLPNETHTVHLWLANLPCIHVLPSWSDFLSQLIIPVTLLTSCFQQIITFLELVL